MTKKEEIFDLIFTTIIRSLLVGMLVFICLAGDALGKFPLPMGLILAIILTGTHIYSVIDEVILTFKD